jgi:hypothetical protein
MTDDRTPSEPPEGDEPGSDEFPPPVFPPVDEPANPPPPPPPSAPVPPAGVTAGMYPEASQATMILVLGILSIVFCQVLGPFAWVMGNKELEAIDAGRRPPENRSNANAGRITGIIGTVLLGLGLLVAIAFLVFGLFIAVGSTTG